jgi:16S rRNA (cytosine967-C5)-methyltransferase
VGAGAERFTAVQRGLSPARSCAFAVIRRVFEQGAYADRALHSEAAGLDPRDRALAMALSYGTVQRRAALDHVAAKLSSRSLGELDPPVLAALRLGLFQLLFLGGVADHAAVNESVELAKRAGGGSTLVNAVLRRAVRDARPILDALDDSDPSQAAVLHSVPDWLTERWWEELGSADARALLRAVNQPAESALRVNELVAELPEVLARLPVPARAASGLPEGIILDAPFDAHASELFGQGAIMPQSRGSMLVARVVEPRPGHRVLDLCAAPGAKTTHLAALIGDRGEVVAVESHRGRAAALTRTCSRMRASCVQVEVDDAAQPRADRPYDRVLVDPPCSGLGTLQSRPDLRWRATPSAVAELAALQERILAVAGAATASGGALVYSVCTISRAESEEVVDRFLAERPEFVADDLGAEYPHWRHPRAKRYLQLLPHRDGTDGFFIARLRRS